MNVPDATVQALGHDQADKGGTNNDSSANALGSAATSGGNAQTATAAANDSSSSVGFNTDASGSGGLSPTQQQQQLPTGEGGTASEQSQLAPTPTDTTVNNNGAAGGSTAVQINSAPVPYADSALPIDGGGAGVPGNNVQAGTTDSTQVNGDKNAIGDGSVAQDAQNAANGGSTAVNANAEGGSTAQNASGSAVNQAGSGTNVLVTDPS